MQATLRAKFRINTVTREIDSRGEVSNETVNLTAVSGSSDENKQWCKWTPNGSINLTINNPDAIGKLTSGHEYFIDFIPAGTKTIAGTSYPTGQT